MESYPKKHRFLPGDTVYLTAAPHSRYTVESLVSIAGRTEYLCRSEFGLQRQFRRSHLELESLRSHNVAVGELVFWQRMGIGESGPTGSALTTELWAGTVRFIHTDMMGVSWIHADVVGYEKPKVVRYTEIRRLAEYLI